MAQPTSVPFRSPAALARLICTAAIGLSLDLWTKSLAQTHLMGASPYDFLPNWLSFEYVGNHGAVFGIAQGDRWIFLIVSFGALIFLCGLFATSGRRPFYQIILGLLLAGVTGNMYDRIFFGYVRDMIHALPGWHWPQWILRILPLPAEVFPWIFNVADTMLCVGVGLMLLYSFLQPVTPKRPEPVDDHA
jgi:signal peptidase II